MATVSDGCAQELPATAVAPALLFKTGAQSMHTRVGFDTPKTLGPRETGSSVPAPIFKDFMARALEGKTRFALINVWLGDAGASALGAALSCGAVPRLERLLLDTNGIGDAGLVALAPALRRPAPHWR